MGIEKKLGNYNNLEEQIRSRMENYEVTPGDHVWDNIRREISSDVDPPVAPWWRSPFSLVLIIAGASTLLFTAFMLTSLSSINAKGIQAHEQQRFSPDPVRASSFQAGQSDLINNVFASIVSSNSGKMKLSGKDKKQDLKSSTHSTPVTVVNSDRSLNPGNNLSVMAGNDKSTPKSSKHSRTSGIHTSQSVSKGSDSFLASHAFSQKEKLVQPELFLASAGSYIELVESIVAEPKKFQQEEPSIVKMEKKKFNLKGFYAGPSIGAMYNWNLISGNYYNTLLGKEISYTPDPGFSAGLTFGYNFHNNVGIETGIHYIRKGQKYTSTNYENPVSGTMKLHYIDIPLILKVQVNHHFTGSEKTGSVKLYGGLEYSYLSRANVGFVINSPEFKMNREFNGKPYLANHNLGFQLGLGYDLYLSKNLIFSIGANSSLLGNVNEFPSWLNKGKSSTANVTFGIQTGIRFFSRTH